MIKTITSVLLCLTILAIYPTQLVASAADNGNKYLSEVKVGMGVTADQASKEQSNNKDRVDFNEGAVKFDSDHMTTDNRIAMFAQREDGSVKRSAEITGGYLSSLVTENKLYLNR